MNRLYRIMVAIVMAFCCLIAAKSARADAPKGGYRVVETRSDGSIVLEVGERLYVETLIRDFGEMYKKTSGKDLTKQVLQAVSYNVKRTIPVCPTPKDGPSWIGRGDTTVWSTCPAEKQELWLIAGDTVMIPVAKVETYAERATRLEALEKNVTDPAWLFAQLEKVGGKSPAVAPPVPQPVPAIQKDVSVSEQSPAPAVIAPATTGGTPFGWHPVYIGLLGLTGVLGYAFMVRPRNRRIATLVDDLRERNSELKSAEVKGKNLVQTRQELKLLSEKFGLMPTDRMSDGQICIAIIQARDALVKSYDQQIEGHKRDIATRAGEAKRQNELQQSLETALNQSKDELGATREQLDQTRRKLEENSNEKVTYSKLEDQLLPSQTRLNEIDDERMKLTYGLERLERGLALTQPEEKREDLLKKAAAARNALELLEVNRNNVLDFMRPAQEEYDAIKKRLTGRPDAAISLRREAQRHLNIAIKASAAAQAEQAAVERSKNEAAEAAQRAITLVAELESQKKALDEREQKLNEAWTAVTDESKRMAEREESLRGEMSEREGQLRIRKDAVEHVLKDALDTLGLDASMSIESILELNGASGILYDATQRTKAAEERAKRLENLLAGRDNELGQTRDALERTFKEMETQRAEASALHEKLVEENADLDVKFEELKKQLDDANARLTLLTGADDPPVVKAVEIHESAEPESRTRNTLRMGGARAQVVDAREAETRSDWPTPRLKKPITDPYSEGNGAAVECPRVEVRELYELTSYLQSFLRGARGKVLFVPPATHPVLREFIELRVQLQDGILPKDNPEIERLLPTARLWTMAPLDRMAEAGRKRTERPPDIRRSP